ncbi:hypothetical protein AnigIFM63326_002338 [Aspergillus niger]|nr:hypothetical protein AnigIFM63326_002338 [Aspergillus niger]
MSHISEDGFWMMASPPNIPESTRERTMAFRNKFRPYEYKKLFSRTAGDIQEGTCRWLVKVPVIKTWLLRESYSVVWLTGSPGMGKTSLVVNFAKSYLALFGENKGSNDTAVLYSLCDSRDHETKKLGKILCVAIHQLLESQTKHEFGLEAIHDAYDLFGAEQLRSEERWNLSPSLLWTYFCNLCTKSNLKKVYLLIDGIDECDRETQKDLFGMLKQSLSTPTNLRVLISSQPLENIEIVISKMKSFKIERLDLHLEEQNVNDDIDLYIDEEVDRIGELRGYSTGQIAYTKGYLKERKCGIFLPIALILSQLQVSLVSELKNILEESANKLGDLELLYEAQMRHILSANFQGPSMLLSSLLYSYRPLTVSELAYLCPYPEEHCMPGREQEECLPHQALRHDLRLLGPLLRIRVSDDTVQFFHSSVQRFLLERWQSACSWQKDILLSPSEGHKALALSCLDILIKCSVFLKTETPYPWENNRGSKLEKVMGKHKLLAYARLYWDSHVKEIFRSTSDHIEDCSAVVEKFGQISDLYADDSAGRLRLFLTHRPNRRQQYGMLPCFEFAPSDEIRRFLEHEEYLSSSSHTGSPLTFYARFGNKQLFHQFIQRQGENLPLILHARDLFGSVLHNATLNGDVSLIKSLVEQYGGKALRTEETAGLLYVSSSSGRSELVKYFLEVIPAIDIDEFLASVKVAVHNGDMDVLNDLLEIWTAEVKDLHGLNVLLRLTTSMSSYGGDSSIRPDEFLTVSTLLRKRGLDLNEADNMGNTVLHHLAWNSSLGTLEVFRQLIDDGADPALQNKGGALPVHLAAHTITCEAFQFLLLATEKAEAEAFRRNISVAWQIPGSELSHLKSHGHLTPLHWVASRRFDDNFNGVGIIKIILSRGFQVTDVTRNGRTPITIALEDPEAFDNFLYIATSLDHVHNIGVSTRQNLIAAIYQYTGKRRKCRGIPIDWPQIQSLGHWNEKTSWEISERKKPLLPDIQMNVSGKSVPLPTTSNFALVPLLKSFKPIKYVLFGASEVLN